MSAAFGWLTVAEAAGELAIARIATLMPPRIYTRLLGQRNALNAEAEQDARQARELGVLLERVGTALPFRALCLQQVIALRRMLRRRGLNSTVTLGLAPDQVGDAHAWLSVGGQIVSGEDGVERFHVIAEFS
ncbi:MAG: lasso peptide biosynthesis B2 protein [Pseudomonadota bacterium]